MGERAGRSLLPPGDPGAPRLSIPADLRDLSGTGGFDLQAARRVGAGDRAGLERMLRYLLHPPLSHDRLSLTPDGRVRLQFSRPWRNGRDAMVLEPHNFISRLVPLVPRPGTHQLVYHGVLAARSRLRPRVVPPRPKDGKQQVMFDGKGNATPMARGTSTRSGSKLARISWARLLHRMAGYPMDRCPRCGHVLVMVAAVLEPTRVASALASRGLGWSGLAPRTPAAGRPKSSP